MFFVGGWVEQQYILCFWIPCFFGTTTIEIPLWWRFCALFVGDAKAISILSHYKDFEHCVNIYFDF